MRRLNKVWLTRSWCLLPTSTLQVHKLAKYATLLSYGYTLNLTVAISEREYHKLSPTVQQVLNEAIEETGAYCTQLTNEQTVIDLERLSEEHGLPVIHPDPETWRNSSAAAIRQICDEGLLAPEMYEELQSLWLLPDFQNVIVISPQSIHRDRNRWHSDQKGGVYETLSEDRYRGVSQGLLQK